MIKQQIAFRQGKASLFTLVYLTFYEAQKAAQIYRSPTVKAFDKAVSAFERVTIACAERQLVLWLYTHNGIHIPPN